jgi:hypothetical protein
MMRNIEKQLLLQTIDQKRQEQSDTGTPPPGQYWGYSVIR